MKVNQIIQGECLTELKKMPDKSIDAVVTDPPFGIGFKYTNGKDVADNAKTYWKWFEPLYKEMLRVLKDGGFVAIWQTQLYFRYFWDWFGDDIHIYAGCKNFVQLRKTSINYGYDPIIMFYKSGNPLRPLKPKRNVDFFVANTASMVSNTKRIERKHPCPRPIDQTTIIIENFTCENAIVLDPFAGSGTIGVACKNLNRNYILIEKEPKYVKIAEE